MSNVKPPPPDSNREKFRHQCDVRAYLWACGVYGHDEGSLARAVDWLEEVRLRYRLDPDVAQYEMAHAFAAVRDDLGGWRP